MKILLTFLISTIFLLVNGSYIFSQTYVSGNVSGTWTSTNSPYYVTWHLTVLVDDALNIEAGVDIRFQGYYKLNVFGLLVAQGTKNDSVTFTRDQPIEEHKWYGLRFLNSDNNSKLEYCKY